MLYLFERCFDIEQHGTGSELILRSSQKSSNYYPTLHKEAFTVFKEAKES